MKKFYYILVIVLTSFQFVMANTVSWTQYFFAIKQIFPEIKNVSILITEDAVQSQQKSIARAATAFKIKVKLFPVKDTRGIGNGIKMVDDGAVLIVYEDPLFMERSSIYYILSKAKDKNISVISCSEKYAEAGAFLSLVKKDSKKLKIVVNLRFKPEFASKFTPELQQKLGVSEVLQ